MPKKPKPGVSVDYSGDFETPLGPIHVGVQHVDGKTHVSLGQAHIPGIVPREKLVAERNHLLDELNRINTELKKLDQEGSPS